MTAALFTRMSGAPTCCDHLGHHPLALVGLRGVGSDRDGFATTLADPLERLAQGADVLLVGIHGAGGERDGRTFGGEPLGDRLPQSAARAGDESNLACTSHHS